MKIKLLSLLNCIKANLLYIGIFLPIFLYLVLRAIYVPMFHDEIMTFYHFVQQNNFIPFQYGWDANNHVLNSFLSYCSYCLFGDSPFALRLPSLLSFIPYFYFTLAIAKKLNHRYLQISFVLILVLTHSFTEFFAITRGYGISMAMLMGGIYNAIAFSQSKKIVNGALVVLLSSLGMLANLSLLNASLLLVAYCLAIVITNKQEFPPLKKYILGFSLIVYLVFLGIMIAYLFGMKENGVLYYGSLKGFYTVTLKTLLLLIWNTESAIVLGIFIFIFYVALLGYILKCKNTKDYLNHRLIFLYLLIGNIVAIYLMAFVLKINYPEDRTGLFLYPFFFGFIFFLADLWDISKLLERVVMGIFIIFLGGMFTHTVNLNYSSLYPQDHLPESFYQKVATYNKQHHVQATIAGYRLREGIWAYPNYLTGTPSNHVYSGDFPTLKADFQIVWMENRLPASWKKKKMPANWREVYDSVDYDPISNQYLLQRKKPMKRIFLSEPSYEKDFNTQDEFHNILLDTITPIANKTILCSIKGEIRATDVPIELHLVMKVFDRENDLFYERIPLDWHLKLQSREWVPFEFNYYIADIPKNGNKFTSYLWNVSKQPYTVKNLSYKLYELRD